MHMAIGNLAIPVCKREFIRQKVCIDLEHVQGSLFSLGLGFVCGTLSLLDFSKEVSMQGWVSLAGLSQLMGFF
jgi:hypothetical protein